MKNIASKNCLFDQKEFIIHFILAKKTGLISDMLYFEIPSYIFLEMGSVPHCTW